jgi:glutamine amidotransferase
VKVVIVDYGMCNLGSVYRALAELGAQTVVAEHPESLKEAGRIVLPGVGSFSDGMSHLAAHGWSEEIRRQVTEAGKPLLGICLGMQLLSTSGTEGGTSPGLDLIPGEVVRLDALGCALRIPHVGWNAVTRTDSDLGLFAGIPDGTDFYFVHSYGFRPNRAVDVLAHTDYGIAVAATVGSGHVFGTQFHPEKSSKAGFRLLKNFLDLKTC